MISSERAYTKGNYRFRLFIWYAIIIIGGPVKIYKIIYIRILKEKSLLFLCFMLCTTKVNILL